MIVDDNSTLENSIDITNIIVDNFIIYTETAGGDVSWINGKNEIQNRSIPSMVKSGILTRINMKTSIDLKQKHYQNYIYAISIVH